MNYTNISVLLLGAAACAGCFGTWTPEKAETPRADFLYISHVHRGGGRKESPDNTLETFKWCWESGSALGAIEGQDPKKINKIRSFQIRSHLIRFFAF